MCHRGFPFRSARNTHIPLPLSDIRVESSHTTCFQTRTTPAYLGRYIRALPTSSRFYLHYAQGGVGSLAPTLRLRCRPGVFHRRAAPPRCPFWAVPSSSASFLLLLSSGCPFFPGSAACHRSGSPFILVYVFYTSSDLTGFSGCGLGLLPQRHRVSSTFLHSTRTTLRCPPPLPGLPGGFQAAAKGKDSSQAQGVHVARRHASLRRASTQFLQRL